MSTIPNVGPGWIATYTGRRVNLVAPSASDVDSRDVARGLAMQCRYNGQIQRFLSVAEHSLAVASLVPAHLRGPALVHDGAETYLGDCVRPLKRLPGMEAFREIEDRWLDAIEDRYGFAPGSTRDPLVKAADRDVCMSEIIALGVNVGTTPQPSRLVSFEFWAPEVAEERFLAALADLGLLCAA